MLNKVLEALKNYPRQIRNPYRRQVFQREYRLLYNYGWLSRIALAKSMVHSLNRQSFPILDCGPAALGSSLFAALDMNPVDPLRHELVFESFLDLPGGLWPLRLHTGLSKRGRLLALFRDYYKIPWEEDSKASSLGLHSSRIRVLLQENIGHELHFAASGYLAGLLPLDTRLAGSARFEFFLDSAADILFMLRKTLREKGISKARLPWEKPFLINWEELEPDLRQLGLSSLLPVVTTMQAQPPRNLEEALLLTAMSLNKPDSSRYRKWDDPDNSQDHLFSYHFMGLLEGSSGLLVYREQAYHITHLATALPYSEAAALVAALRSADSNRRREAARGLAEAAYRQGLPDPLVNSIIGTLSDKAGMLLSRQEALHEFRILFELGWYKTKYRRSYGRAMNAVL